MLDSKDSIPYGVPESIPGGKLVWGNLVLFGGMHIIMRRGDLCLEKL